MYIYCTAGFAPLHKGPKLFAPVIAYIPAGSSIETAFYDGFWYRVYWQGQWGYIQTQYVSPQRIACDGWKPRYGDYLLSVALCASPNPYTRNLQHDLNAFFAPFSPKLEEDGIFGPQTRQALIHFQRIRGLAIHGAATSETKTSLYAASLRLLMEKEC